MAGATPSCIFCRIATKSTPTTFLYSDDKVVAFQDISPSAFRFAKIIFSVFSLKLYDNVIDWHYLVIPVEHIPTVNKLQKRDEDYSLDLAFISLHLTVLTIYTSIVWHYLSYPNGNI
ncbi:hypothetical protein SADUNF_Sadunf03G0050800 [Salix dunnii]|uniref:Uncharacterized protein n=1 Tax=Salix dunnii TaxID=1413687 RepID=A0A835N398_9ROSI|nr:hypothetical protein SADUNF_Sadunf03G0050800 [Salix dunnii]